MEFIIRTKPNTRNLKRRLVKCTMYVVSVGCILPLSYETAFVYYAFILCMTSVLVQQHQRDYKWKSYTNKNRVVMFYSFCRTYPHNWIKIVEISHFSTVVLVPLIAENYWFLKHLWNLSYFIGGSDGSLRNPGSRRHFSYSKSFHDSRPA